MQDNIVKTFIYLFFNFGSLGPPYKYITSDVTFAVTDFKTQNVLSFSLHSCSFGLCEF